MSNKKKNNIISFPSSPSKLDRQVEAILFSASEPLDVETIESKISKKNNVLKSLEKLQAEYTCMRCKIKYNRMNFDKLRICPKCTNKESK